MQSKVFVHCTIIQSDGMRLSAAHRRLFARARPKGKIRRSRAMRGNATLPPSENMDMECIVKWAGTDGMAFLAETGSGHLLTMDGAPEGGGRDLAPRPMEVVLAGAGGCTAYDVVLILKRGRQDVRGCSVRLVAERDETDPKVFTRIHFYFTVSGHALRPEAVERAIRLSAEKYCSASIMLGKTAEITHEWTIVEAD